MEDAPEEKVPLKIEALDSDGVIVHLGVMASHMLKSSGMAIFVRQPNDTIAIVNPTQVLFLSDALKEPPFDKLPKLVRPGIQDGRPQFVAYDQNGVLWEIEYTDEEEET